MKLAPMMTHYLSIKEKYNDCIIFYRLGDFYEMFFEDAELVSKEIGLTLTGRDCGREDGERAPMCGVPAHAYESYATKLINKGYKVAICEQLTEPSKGAKIVERDVVRVITPGTVIDSSMVEDRANTYIMCIYQLKDTISFAYADISTGEFAVGKSNTNAINYINDQIVCVNPAEIICNTEMYGNSPKLPIVMRDNCAKFSQYYEWAFNTDTARKNIIENYGLNSLSGYDFDDSNYIKPVGALLNYLRETQKRDLKHLSLPRVLKDEQFMYLDNNTRRNLELESRMKDGNKTGSLLWVLDKTCTSAGARLMRTWVNKPLQDINEINTRLNVVEYLVNNASLRAGLVQELNQIGDIERLVGRLSYGNITPKDFIALKNSIPPTVNIKHILTNCNNDILSKFGEDLKDLSSIAEAIYQVIEDEPSNVYKDGGYIKRTYDSELARLKDLSEHANGFIKEMEVREREKTGIRNLKIGYNRVFGYYIEVSKQYSSLVPFEYIRKQTISNNERYVTEELKQYENEVINSTEQALKLEAEIYENFKSSLMPYCSMMQKLAQSISKLDCLVSLATVAVNNNYCKPNISNDSILKIKNGRHPVIELLQKQNSFISNDTELDNCDDRTMILTGPNMAGKSTYMRQVALISIMAHIGSFVPASEARVCIIDRIFTRIGASDDLAVGQSTFMVEMVEVSNILTFATNKSLIILDEVGRGTSTHDGMSIASSVVEYLSKSLNCKTLFATHYHELMHLEGQLEGVKNYCISIKEIGGELVFLRKIMRGSATKSYGIEVASLAGLPKTVINRAKEIMNELENSGNANTQSINNNNAVIESLKKIDINSISPLTAFDTLSHLIDMVKE